MNKKHVLFHLKEAKEELDRTIEEIERDAENYSLYVAMMHLYSHLNTAWNARERDPNHQETDADFYHDRQFPKDLPID